MGASPPPFFLNGAGLPRVASPPNSPVVNGVNDGGMVPDGIPSLGTGTDNAPLLNALLSAFTQGTNAPSGGTVMLPPGFYGISSPVNVVRGGTRLCGMVGGQTTRGNVVLFALPNFTGGSLVVVNVPPGDKGAYLDHLKLDGNNVAGVTACLELATGTLSKCTLADLQLNNAPIGLLTNDNCQSTNIERVFANSGLLTSLSLGTNNRHMTFYNCVFADTSTGALIGPNDAVAGNVNSNIQFHGCEFYTQGASTGPALTVRNATGCSFFACWAEHAGTQNPLTRVVQWGTATASADRTSWFAGRLIGNAKATTLLEIVQGKDCVILNPVTLTPIGQSVTLTDAASRAIIYGAVANPRTGARLVNGNSGNPFAIYGSMISGTLTTPSEAILVSGVDASVTNAIEVTLTAARLVGAPLATSGAFVVGQQLSFTFIQGGAGGFAVTWNAVFKKTWSDAGNVTGARSSILFQWDGTNWNQVAAQAPYV